MPASKDKKKSSKSAAVVSQTEPDAEPPVKVNLYEPGALKHAMDEMARYAIINAGYEEDLFISNVKIGMGLVAIVLALYAQFGVGKFPGSWWPTLACVAAYVVLTLVLSWFCQKYEGNAFLVTQTSQGLMVASHMPRFSDQYTLVVEQRGAAARSVQRTVSIASYFHADGYMAEDAWRETVEAVLKEYEMAAAAAAAASTQAQPKPPGPKKTD